ncbi:unnamed protein product [Candidula unifasciata]|uniref:C2H2-type domain-containing protein n=1 Tax=Candidula unifasciata TaxID=100452 RepID=A0A8S4A383_9EUPU|nr:unnamed protein product [Candidula unifasciata]
MEETCLKQLHPSNGPRPHRCDVCHRSFREIATLHKHEQLHRADRPYTCNTCGKSFLWSSNLKVHERVHTGERPYKCKICHRCFTQSNDLRRHERNVHMRGKIYGYKPAGRQASQVNLAAYQAFAMQQRALLQQALTYETYLQKAAISKGQNTQLFHHTQGVDGPQPQELGSSPRSPLTVEQVNSMDLPHNQSGSVSSFANFKAMPKPLDGLQNMTVGSRHLPQAHQSHNSDSHLLPHTKLRLSQEMINFHHQHHNNNNNNITKSNINGSATSRCTPPPQLSPQELFDHEKDVDQRSKQMNQHHFCREDELRDFHHGRDKEMETQHMENGSSSQGPKSMELERGSQQQDHSISSNYSHQNPKTQNLSYDRMESQASLPSYMETSHDKSYPCDSVMDLSMNKSSNSPPLASGITSSSTEKETVGMTTLLSKAESESDTGKRDVTTTSTTPLADSGGIHHCQHCNIFFYDYTMFHLHESLHMPYENHPFRCPSCGTHCQDKVEFMFHTVWHVKYPHTIPNYTPFREGCLSSP